MEVLEQGKKQVVWLDGRGISSENHDFWSVLASSALRTVVVERKQRHQLNLPLGTRWVVEVDGAAELEGLDRGDIVMSTQPELLAKAKDLGHPTCIFLSIDDREALEAAWVTARKADYAVVEFDLPTNIPLELIIARLQDSDTILLKREATLEDMLVAFGVMERGSDGVLLSTTDIGEIMKVNSYLLETDRRKIRLMPLVVEEVRHIGMGFRGCIDTTNLLGQDEGMLVGSTSTGGVLVCSETHFLPHMNLRPFRVNAGAVHSYVWMFDDKVEYITDLEAGSRAMAVSTSGEVREVVVGRVKTEVRPLLLIKGHIEGQPINVILQDDWHIRVMGADGKPKNATLVSPGDELMGYLDQPGRHVGLKVRETILER
ncbi:MAG: 3-dehydroquinate synthase [Firmicutes bacterium]|nr:3-dehydroquinate synthase [Bacillota bacterium]